MNRIISLDEKPVLDLRFTAFEHLHGAILVIGSWYMDPDTRESEPALVLLDAARKVARKKTIPCIIPLSQMWLWTVERGDPRHVGDKIHEWLKSGALPGSPNNKRDCWAVMDAVQSRLRDIVTMPPLPVGAAVRNGAVPATVGEVVITEGNTGKILAEIEVKSRHVRH